MRTLILLISLLFCPVGAADTLRERRVASLTRGIDLMARDTAKYQRDLTIMQGILLRAVTDTDMRNARTRIKEITLVLKSLAHRIELAEKELKELKQ